MLKKTKTRESVLKILENASTPISANDIYLTLKNDNITLSSIYRTLILFTKKKWLLEII